MRQSQWDGQIVKYTKHSELRLCVNVSIISIDYNLMLLFVTYCT